MKLSAFPASLRPTANVLAKGISALLRLSLVLSTWNAPLPVLHAHEVGGDETSHQSAVLKRHVFEYHEDAAIAGTSYLGWHVHWLLPNQWQSFPCHRPTNCPGCPGDRSSGDENFVLCSSTAVPAKTVSPNSAPDFGKPVWLPALADAAHHWATHSRGIRQEQFPPLHFLGSYQGSTSLNQLLGVWRC